MLIREIGLDDAEKLANLMKQVEYDAQYMLFESGERNIKPEQLDKMIEVMKSNSNSTILVAEINNELVGYLIAKGDNANRKRHSVYLVIGILTQYRGMGLGTKLFEELEEWANEHNIHRLELTVVTRNDAGVQLYKKAGFDIEGTKRHALYIDGEFVDEYYMSKLL